MKIAIIRHGESVGNKDRSLWSTMPDHQFHLTEDGVGHVETSADRLAQEFSEPPIMFVSPLLRTRQTAEILQKRLGITERYEDPRLRERSMGYMAREEHIGPIMKEREKFGKFYYPFERGESGLAVFDRVSSFMTDLAVRGVFDCRPEDEDDHYLKVPITSMTQPRDILLVTHSYTLRVLLMYLLRLTVDEFEILEDPHYASFVVIDTKNLSSLQEGTFMESLRLIFTTLSSIVHSTNYDVFRLDVLNNLKTM